MTRQFNVAGPCREGRDYMIPAERRLPGVRELIDGQNYFVVHAPRQVGKTTCLLALAENLTAEGKYAAILMSCEAGGASEPAAAFANMVRRLRRRAEALLPAHLLPPEWPMEQSDLAPSEVFGAWARACPRPLVVFLDEVDGLHPEVLGLLLRQLRDGHSLRPEDFPWSLGLIGMRDVKDYVIASGGTGRRGAGSPFNVVAESIRVRDFTFDEVAELLAQHTADTGQVFVHGAVHRVWASTRGQPWLVNALAREATHALVRDRRRAIDASTIDHARINVIRRMDPHLESLTERLREDRVRRVVEPILAGELLGELSPDDLRYASDLGLVRTQNGSTIEIANPIYRDVLPRSLAATLQATLPEHRPSWLDASGRLDAERLLADFLAFWKQHGEPLMQTAPYHEIAPHLVLMAFLHRVANAKGTIDREYAIGSGRMDLCLTLGDVRLGIEMKVWRDGRPDPVTDGLAQLDEYLSGLGLSTGWLVSFDRRTTAAPISERTTASKATSPAGRAVTVVRA